MALTGLEAWVEKLGKKDMPVLSAIVKELNELTGSDEAEVNQLAEVVLKDANLTSQVLRIANSVHYNPSSYPINTISRAIVLIGFGGVRAICISVMMIDSLLGRQPRERLLEQMAQGFHAAVQARNLVRRTNEEVQEEVFIAALLFHLGAMSFWASGGKEVDRLDELLTEGKLSDKDAMEQVTGTSFKAITRALAKNWNLGETLEQALYPPQKPSPKVIAVRIGEELSRAAVKGWDSVEVAEALKKVMAYTGLDLTEARKMVVDNADEAASVALTYGAARVCHLIPSSRSVAPENEPDAPEPMQADHELQLNILRELSNALSENLDVNTIFQMVLEGMHRGIGLERVALAFIQDDQAIAKYVLGEGTEGWRKSFTFPLDKNQDNIFTYARKAAEPVWFDGKLQKEQKHLYSPEIIHILGKYQSFIAPIRLGARDVALFYADRWKLGGVLQKEHFQSFRHFVMQTQMSLQMLAEKRK